MADSTTSIDSALVQVKQRYADANPRSRQLNTDAAASLPGGNTRTTLHFDPFPLAFASASGAHLTSVDGRGYIDLLGDYTAGLYGHSHPVILGAIHHALDRGISYGGHNADEARLARHLVERFPSIDLVRFTNSGTEANLLALALATALTGRRKVLVFSGAYHGGVLTFADGPAAIDVPHQWVMGDYNDVEGTRRLIDEHADGLAAILVEPMVGSGGCIPGSAEFLEMLRSAASAVGAVLIFDEVMTSRLSVGGLQQTTGIHPDLTTLGKYLGGGMSFGAFGGRRELMEHFDPTRENAWPHAGTFNNNVLTMAAGAAGLDEVLTPKALSELNERGDALRGALNQVFSAAAVDMQVTGLGSLMTIQATAAPISAPRDLRLGSELVKELFFFDMLEAGFWMARRCMIALSLPVADGELSGFVSAVERFVDSRADLLPQR
jgi:glutamate-1-semialdehyde 2,1-aminomutase